MTLKFKKRVQAKHKKRKEKYRETTGHNQKNHKHIIDCKTKSSTDVDQDIETHDFK